MAAAAGMSLYALQTAIKAGRITPLPDGSFDREAGLAELRQKTDPTKNRGPRPAQVVEAALPTADAVGPAASYDEIRRKLDAGEAMDFMEARTANEVLKARQAIVKLDEMTALLVPRAEFKIMREAENQAIKDRARAVANSVAERVVDCVLKGGRGPEVQDIILAEIDAALEDAVSMEVKIAA